MRLTKGFETFAGQRAEIQLDMFNVANGVGQLFCSDEDREDDPFGGPCGWGRVTGVFGADRNLLTVRGFEQGSNRILYGVSRGFATEDVLGANLLLQFQAQLGFRYYF
jgi:hypothetical protein